MGMRIVNYVIKKILLQVRWFTMSNRDRYAYLWNRTRDSL